ncbi:MAG: hypothetical protein ABI054_03190 [Planctomycetota bacterium]
MNQAVDAKRDVATAAPPAAEGEVLEPAVPAPDSAREQAAGGSLRSESGSRQPELLLLDPEGHAVADARVALFREKELLAKATTDTAGLASFAPQQGKARYAIAALGWELARGEFELSAGRTTITLADDAFVAGVARVDHAPPPESFELQWRAETEVPLPDVVLKALQRSASNPVITVALTQPDGSFQFRGVRANAIGWLRWSAPYFLRDVENELNARGLKVPAPRRDIVLDLVAGVELRLRVVDAEGKPLPGAGVRFTRHVPRAAGKETSWQTMNQVADSQGRYRQALAWEESDNCTVSVSAPGSAAWKEYSLTRPPLLRGVWDVGDLATIGNRTLLVRVQNVDGSPLWEANVYAWTGDAPSFKLETDAAGMVSIEIGELVSKIAVEKFTYLTALVEVPSDTLEVVVTLQRACVIQFLMSDPTRERDGLVLELIGPSPLFDGDTADPPRIPERPTTDPVDGPSEWTHDGNETTLVIHPQRGVHWKALGLLPHQSLRARLRGGREILSEISIPPLSPGEVRIVTFPPIVLPRTLTIRVLSPELEPVPSAMIRTARGGESLDRGRMTVNEQGELTLPLYGDRFDFVVHSKLYALKRVSLMPIPEGRFDVVLEPAKSSEVELVQRDGAPYTADVNFFADVAEGIMARTALGPGLYRLDGLPDEEVLLTFQSKSGWTSRLLRTGDPRLRIVVDEPGTIEATIEDRPDDGDGRWMLEATSPGAARGSRAPVSLGKSGFGATFRGLPAGEYEVWFLHTENALVGQLARLGSPVLVVIDTEHPKVQISLKFPD